MGIQSLQKCVCCCFGNVTFVTSRRAQLFPSVLLKPARGLDQMRRRGPTSGLRTLRGPSVTFRADGSRELMFAVRHLHVSVNKWPLLATAAPTDGSLWRPRLSVPALSLVKVQQSFNLLQQSVYPDDRTKCAIFWRPRRI